MKKQKTKTIAKIITYLLILVTTIGLLSIDVGAETTRIKIEAQLEKYVNYNIANQETGTLVQYQVKGKIEYGEEQEHFPIQESEFSIQFDPIDGKYPKTIKVLGTSYEYDTNTGTLTIKAQNPEQEIKYTIICDYDTYSEENKERELAFQLTTKYNLQAEGNIWFQEEGSFNTQVTEDKGELTSIEQQANNLYNGNIKSNKINGTNYHTTFQQNEPIMISKKEDVPQIELKETNQFVKIEKNQNEQEIITDLENNKSLIYQNTKIAKESLIQVLGEEGQVEIFDLQENLIGIINKDNEIVTYEQEPEAIMIKTTPIQNEGVLLLEHTKQIKETMLETQNIKIKTISQINGKEKIALLELQEATTNMEIDIDKSQWNNQQQNEVTFGIRLNAETIKDNMFHQPSIKIKLPNQVEKVILTNTSLYYANGLELQDPYLETDKEGNQFIIANLQGKQTKYHENNLNLATQIKISATIILKKELQSTKENIEVMYTNQYTLDGRVEEGSKQLEIQIQNNQEKEEIEKIATYQKASIVPNNEEKLKLEIAPMKGEAFISNGDTVYEGEYIKYNIKVTNTSKETINQVKVQATIPEGTIYGELEADYHNRDGEYTYRFYEDVKTKEIEIGSIQPGESISKFYEVQVKDLEEDITQKQIVTNMQAKIGETEVANYEMINVVKPAELKVFLSSNLYGETNRWNYHIMVTSDQYDKEPVTVTVKLPKTFEVEYFNNQEKDEIEFYEEDAKPKDNVFTVSVRTNEKGYYLSGLINPPNAAEQTNESKIQLIATASVSKNNNTYQANENRIDYTYENVSISMTSETEGEEVKYEEEINYKITVTNIGKNNLNDSTYSYIPVQVTDFLPENVKPVSITYDSWEIEKIENEQGVEITGNYRKLDPITKELTNQMEAEDGKKYADVELELEIPYQQSVTIEVKTQAEAVYEKTKIENQASVVGVEGRNIVQKNSNIITHIILPFLSEGEDQENPDEPTNPGLPEEPDNPDGTHSIAGVAWLDENEDGKRQENEKLLNGIIVRLMDTNHNNKEKSKTTTNNKGIYYFSNIEKGNYFVIFDYDASNYSLTTYQKNGVPNHLNSDASEQTITLEGKTKQVGITDVISLNQSISNIDIGLIKHKRCDVKIDKTISKVTVVTKDGTNQYDYQNEKLAKIEVKAKQIQGATIAIEYKIVITNQGEAPVTVNKVMDQLPEGLTFSSELNRNWSQQTKGQLINTAISDQKIAVGQSKELTLVLTKMMKQEDTGTYSNHAKIAEIMDDFGTQDEDESNNTSQADVIISISTGGLVTYLSIAIITILIVSIIVFLSYRYGVLTIGKVSLFTIIIGITLVATTMESQAQEYYQETYPKEASFRWDGKGTGISTGFDFTGGPTGKGACQNHGKPAHGSCPSYATPSGYIGYNKGIAKETGGTTIVNQTNPTISVKNTNYEIQVRKVENNLIYGPFSISCDKNVGYSYEVYNSKGIKIATPATCDKNGNNKTVTGTATFYLKLPIEQCYNGVSRIKAIASYKANRSVTYKKWGEITYTPKPDDGCQRVTTINGYAQLGTGTKTELVTVTGYAQWTNIRGLLEITKQDKEETQKTLAGVKIQLECKDINYNQEFVTDEQGKINVDNLVGGKTYTLTELENPNYGYTKTTKENVKINVGSYTNYQLLNEKQTGNLQITKQDKDIIDENQKRLNHVSFKINNAEGNYIIAVDEEGNEQTKVTGNIQLSDLEMTQDKEKGTEFITDDNGQIGIKNLLVDNYTIEETGVGDHFGYEIDDDYISWNNGTEEGTGAKIPIQIQRQNSQDTKTYANQLEVNNKKKYIKLSGYVWEDKADGGKEAKTNNLYDQQDNDKRLKNVTVTLKNNKGQVIDTRVTNTITNTKGKAEQGAYLFGDYQRDSKAKKIKIEDLEGGYIEFSYNGMCYQSVEINTEIDNGSKATDQNVREKFNNDYATITKGRAENGDYQLAYKFENHKSTLQYGGNYLYGYEEQKYPIAGINSQYLLVANTKTATPNHLLGQKLTMKEVYEQGINEIENINLGLKEREMPDLSIIQDVETAQIKLNGYTYTYRYEDRFSKLNEEIEKYIQEHPEDKNQFNVGVNFGSKYGKDSYTTTIYSSDIVYKKEDVNGDLGVCITYKIKLTNEASTVNTKINQLYNYHDQDFIVTNLTDENGNKVDYEYDESYAKEDKETGNIYQRILIHPQEGIKLQYASNQYLYITYQLKEEAIIKILNTDKVLGSATEIVSYGSYQDEEFKNPYAGIDRDSEPNNATIGDETTYEDDIDQAPSLILKSNETRTIEGTVWQEDAIETLLEKQGYDKERLGNGKYEKEVEKVVQNVQVELLKVDEESGKVEPSKLYPKVGLVEANQTSTTTDQQGNYRFEGVIPGKYIIQFTYKNSSILCNLDGTELGTLQDLEGGVEYYKSTSYRTMIDQSNRNNINKQAYQKTQADNNENYLYWYADETQKEDGTRLSDAKDNAELVNKRISAEEIGYEQATQKETGGLEEISAQTSLIEIRLDCDANDIKNITKDSSQYSKQRLEYRFDNIDFGIIRRPKQNLRIEKQISNIELALASGELLVKGDPRTETIKHIKYLPDGNVHIEIDDEIIQSANLKLEYELTVDNQDCEIDYNSLDYYDFGIRKDKTKNWKIATVLQLFDYPSNGLEFESERNVNSDWKQIKLADLRAKGRVSKEAQKALEEYNIILATDKFANMTPGEKRTEKMQLSRLLANVVTGDVSFNNNIEINLYNGRKMDYTIPGNYDPSNSLTEENDNDGKNIAITGVTGENKNYLPYVLLGTTSFILFGIGVILIKKKVLG